MSASSGLGVVKVTDKPRKPNGNIVSNSASSLFRKIQSESNSSIGSKVSSLGVDDAKLVFLCQHIEEFSELSNDLLFRCPVDMKL